LGGYALGTIAFAVPANQELGDILDKSHGIQVHLSRSSTRMAIYHDIQVKNKHKPMLVPNQQTKQDGMVLLMKPYKLIQSWVTYLNHWTSF
jgi:hypothetical protein